MGSYPRAYFAKKVDKDGADVKADGPVKVSKRVSVKKAASEVEPSEEKIKVKRVSKKAESSKKGSIDESKSSEDTLSYEASKIEADAKNKETVSPP